MKLKYLITSIIFFVLGVGLISCDDDKETVKGISLDKGSVTIEADAITQVISYPVPWDAEVTERFTWTSENEAVARVNSKGQVLGVDPGETNIICHYQDLTSTVHVTVRAVETLQEKINALQAKGYWEFEDPSDLSRKSIGNDLVFVEDNNVVITSINGPRFDNKAIRVPRYPQKAGVTGTFVKCIHGLQTKNGEAKINEYTILWDIRLPDEEGMPESGYYSLMSTRTLDNTQDQDFAIKRAGCIGIGSLGYSSDGVLTKGKWHRVVLSAKAGAYFTYYVDGSKVYDGKAEAGPVDGRFSLLPEGVLFFSDEDGDDSTIDAAAIAIWDRPLTSDEVKKLGGVRQTVVFGD